MKAFTLALVLSLWMLCMMTPAAAQQPEASSSLQRVRLSLQKARIHPKLTTPRSVETTRTNIGILTLVPPQYPGEIVRLSLPVGDLATRAARALSAAQRRRAERQAREHVRRAMVTFAAQQRVASAAAR